MPSCPIAPPAGPPVWVSQPEVYQAMLDDLASRAVIAVDTESNSLYAYREQVCLIQFSTGEQDYLVDPFAISDLSGLAPIFANPKIQKVFHAAEYDLICLKRDYGFQFANLFDTMIASRTLGRSAVGLAGVLENEFGVVLDKHYQRANWGERPLTTPMLAYARLDTYYLIALRPRLEAALQTAGRLELAREDFQRLCDAPAIIPENDAVSWWRVAGGQDLTGQQAAVLAELCKYRDQRARQADLPPFKVLPNQALLDAALACPDTLQRLSACSGLKGRLLDRHGEALLHAIRRGLAAHPLHRPSQPRPDERYLARLDRLKTWRKQTGQNWGVESDVILPRDVMERLAQTAPRALEDLAEPMASVPWRYNYFGDHIFLTLARK